MPEGGEHDDRSVSFSVWDLIVCQCAHFTVASDFSAFAKKVRREMEISGLVRVGGSAVGSLRGRGHRIGSGSCETVEKPYRGYGGKQGRGRGGGWQASFSESGRRGTTADDNPA